ncbi:MAG TPA: glycosyltransferase [Pyrinomonadaceae bacterium]|nr:glycosyltransferase [Pyrinomonadaceae bacterium]
MLKQSSSPKYTPPADGTPGKALRRQAGIRILTNLGALNQSHCPDTPLTFSYVTEDDDAKQFLANCIRSDLVIVHTDPTKLMLACALKWVLPLRFKIVSVDLIVRTPRSLSGRIKTFLQKILFKRVHRFILYFKDLRGCERLYGIGPERTIYVPFKVNQLREIQRRLAIEPPGDGEYVMCAGRTMRDIKTFVAAMKGVECPGILHQQPADMMAAHGTDVWQDELPPNLKLVIDDSYSHEVFLDFIAKARLIVIPRYKNDIGPAGIATYLVAMAMNKCVVISEGPGVGDVLTNEAVIVPPEDAAALAQQIALLWDDHTQRREIAKRGQRYATSAGGDDRLYGDIVRTSVKSFVEAGFASVPQDETAVRQTLPIAAAIGVRQTSEDV